MYRDSSRYMKVYRKLLFVWEYWKFEWVHSKYDTSVTLCENTVNVTTHSYFYKNAGSLSGIIRGDGQSVWKHIVTLLLLRESWKSVENVTIHAQCCKSVSKFTRSTHNITTHVQCCKSVEECYYSCTMLQVQVNLLEACGDVTTKKFESVGVILAQCRIEMLLLLVQS